MYRNLTIIKHQVAYNSINLKLNSCYFVKILFFNHNYYFLTHAFYLKCTHLLKE